MEREWGREVNKGKKLGQCLIGREAKGREEVGRK